MGIGWVRTALVGAAAVMLAAAAGQTAADAQTPPPAGLSNLGITVSATAALEDGGVAFTAAEGQQGIDLNNDGDTNDTVVHHADPTGAITNLNIASQWPAPIPLDGGGFVFKASESNQGTDLNNDGDTNDTVVHHADPTGSITNLNIAANAELYDDPAALDGSGFVFNASETGQGNTDLNGDGDTDDNVVHHVDPTGTVANLAIAESGYGSTALGGGAFAFNASETGQGNTDLNGDGDTDDWVMHHVDPTGTITDFNIASQYQFPAALDGSGFVFNASETGQGNTDLNGDGDTDDYVVHHVDPTGAVTNLAIAESLGSAFTALSGGGFAFSTAELHQGADLNGDGDTNDFVSHHVDPTGTVANLAIAENGYASVALDGGWITFNASETGQGNTDLNGDGDTNDTVAHRVDPSGTVTNLAIVAVAYSVALDGGGFAFRAGELHQGADLNGDGDTNDFVMHGVDPTGTVANLAIADSGWGYTALDGGGFTFAASEAGQANTDLNGDGDTDDNVMHRVDPSGAVTNLAIADNGWGYTALDGGGFTFAASEAGQANTDLNGDGDTDDPVLHMTVGGLAVTNDADPTSVTEPGGNVTYTVAITNTSLVDAITIESLIDDTFGPVGGDSDCRTGSVLATGASCTFDYTATVTGGAGTTHTSTVTAAGTDDDGVSVTGSDDATVWFSDVASSISLTDEASPTTVAEPGGDVAHSVTVTNTSPADAVLLGSLTDSIAGDLAGQGDCTMPQALAPSATYTCTYTATVTGGAGTTHTSTVTAAGTDDDGVSVTGSDDATVLVTEVPGPVVVTSPGGDDMAVEVDGPGAIFTVEAVEPPADVTPPPGASFPYGLVGFTVAGVPAGGTATVTIDFPAPLADPFAYFKLQGGTYVDATSIATHDNGRVTLALTDNGPFDSDPTPGVITDPGGPVTVATPTGDLVISKAFDPLTSGVVRTFTINWSCDNATAGTVQLAGGQSATVAAIAVGTVCSVSEARPSGAPSGWYYQTPTIAGSPATITAGAPSTVTVTNAVSRLTRPLRINMTLNGAPAGFAGVFMIHVECSGDGGTYDRAIAWPLVRSATIPAVPTNTQCTVSEPSVSAPPAGFGWAAPTFAPNPVTIAPTGTTTVTVTNRLLDTAAPVATFTRPGPNNPLLRGRSIQLNGNATDNVGVTSVKVAIRNTTTGRHLQPNGSWAPAYATLNATVGSQGARNTTWRISRPLPDGNYTVELVPTDAAANTPTPRPTRNFRVDAP